MGLSNFFSNHLLDAHKELFYPEPFWFLLSRLEAYLATFPLGKVESPLPSFLDLQESEKIFIGKGCSIESGVTLQGPCVIGNNCEIRQGAYIRKGSYIGPGSLIGHATEVKGSFLFNGVKAAHFAYIGDSILGENVLLGAGVVCANVRLDGGEILSSFYGKKETTGRKKLGALIGDGARIGCNSVLNPGALVEKQSLIAPLSKVQSRVKVQG